MSGINRIKAPWLLRSLVHWLHGQLATAFTFLRSSEQPLLSAAEKRLRLLMASNLYTFSITIFCGVMKRTITNARHRQPQGQGI